jgi:malate synthase
LYERYKVEELEKIKQEIGEQAYEDGRFTEAVELFDQLILNDEFTEFLTLPGYEIL